MIFGEYLKNLRKENKLSQRKLAELANISNTEVSRIESGERQKASPNILKAIAPHLKVSYSTLMTKAGYIEENIEHDKYTESIFRDDDGNLQDTIRLAKSIEKRDSEFLTIMNRAFSELSDKDLQSIKNFVNFHLHQNNK